MKKEIIFRARRKDNGEWVEGNYHHNIRKGERHTISPKDTNEDFEVYRESLQWRKFDLEWEDV